MSYITYKSKWHCLLCLDSRQGGRKENQDCCGYKETPFGFLVVICDGMGGGPAGANASMLAVQSIIQEVDKAAQALPPETVLNNAIIAANALLRRTIKEHQQLMGMGTTCVAALIATNIVTVAHIGDSRLYLFRNRKKIFRTTDHSVVGEMVRRGELTEEDARRAENSNIITRSLGISDTIEVEIDVLNITQGDRIVLCTDGVWGMMREKELSELLCRNDRIDYILTNVLDGIENIGKGKPNGNYDNLSLGIISINQKRENKQKQEGKSSLLISLMSLALFLSISANIYFLMQDDSNEHKEPVAYNYTFPTLEQATEKDAREEEDTRLEEQFSKRREQEYKDSIADMREKIAERKLDNKKKDICPNRVRLLNQIANDVKSLNTPKGGDAKKILHKKRNKQQQIIKDFELLRKDFSQSKTNRQKYDAVSIRLSGDKLIATQQDGASTQAAKQEITEVAKQLNALK